ncbi:MAG: GNAT family N-acetyltransferase [Pseudomonadota bacterium]|nr:GNAT family N-acetyltransferase [Pseudomonadota bacterium]
MRREVFIEEQGVPEALEQDAHDAGCWHALARDHQGHAIGTGRLLADGHIGRLAVRRPWRGRGVGRTIMQRLVELARRQGFAEVELNAQTHALAFYEGLGFRAEGEVFMEAGIPHRRMRRRLQPEER